MSHCVTFHQKNFLSLWNIGLPLHELLTFRFRFPISVLHHGGLRLKLPWTKKFFQKTVSVIIWHLTYSFHKNQAALSGRTHRSEAYPLCKNAMTDPFNRDPEGLPKNVLFTTLQLNRKCTAFPQDSMENGFPMSSACNQVHVLTWLLISTISQANRRVRLLSIISLPSRHLIATRGRENSTECYCRHTNRANTWGLLFTMAALHLCVVMRLNVTDGRKVCMSHNEDTVITSPIPPSWFCLPVYLWPRFFFLSAFIWLNSSLWAESKGWSTGRISSRHIVT